jgi:hypothetical protein
MLRDAVRTIRGRTGAGHLETKLARQQAFGINSPIPVPLSKVTAMKQVVTLAARMARLR